MRICLYSEEALPELGGQEMVVDRLARGLLTLGHAVTVLAPWRRGQDRGYDARLPYAVVRHPRFRSTRWFVASYGWWLGWLHRREAFDVVHCHSVHPTGYVAARCGAIRGVPLVISSHGGDVDDVSPLYRKPGLAKHYRLALRRADALVAPSEFIEGRLRQWCDADARIERVAHGIDLDEYAASVPRPVGLDARIQPGRFFLFLGRTVRRKGVDVLLEAFHSLGIQNSMCLAIAGVGTGHAELVARAGELGLAGRVVFLDYVEGPTKTWLLQNASCNVVPSRYSEAFGLTVIESFAAGRPVIASDVPGLRELVTDGRNGVLVPPDSAEDLARAMRRAVDQREWLDRLGQEARQTARQYTWNQAVERYAAIYEDLIRRRSMTR
ncbi:MAG TPA: glycosyltransferase family 4 protein [Thermoguttaceae bacterium]|nr:glycosyltransferase family 4 protein [Thermoguttaceae bacterium]